MESITERYQIVQCILLHYTNTACLQYRQPRLLPVSLGLLFEGYGTRVSNYTVQYSTGFITTEHIGITHMYLPIFNAFLRSACVSTYTVHTPSE